MTPLFEPADEQHKQLTATDHSAEPMVDDDSLAGRIRRYAQVGSTVGGLAARLAGNRLLGLSVDPAAHAVDLKVALGGLKGPLMKVAQILATLPDVMPEEYTRELAQLQTNAPSMGRAFVRRRMVTELGAGWEKKYRAFEHTARAAASLGQVHEAIGLDGSKLACKLQYPDMASAVEADLRQLKIAFTIYRQYDRAIDPSNIHAELSARLREELDYRREAKHMALYGRMLSRHPGVHVPEPSLDLSSERLLTMTWLDGEPLMSFVDHHIDMRNTVARNMFHAWYVPFYEYGVLHGDPHLGNYTVRKDGSINLLDFGCVRIFPPEFVGAVIDLYHALRTKDQDLAVKAYETWGFKNLSHNVIEILNQWAGFLYRPLMEDRIQPIQEEGGAMYGAQVAGKVQRELREVGGIAPPREFVLMDRAAIGLGSVFTRLRAEVNWHQLFSQMIESFDVAAVARRQSEAMAGLDLPAPL